MTMRRIADDDFNSGWNAALDATAEAVKKMPTETVADDGVRTLIAKCDVLDLLRGAHGESERTSEQQAPEGECPHCGEPMATGNHKDDCSWWDNRQS